MSSAPKLPKYQPPTGGLAGYPDFTPTNWEDVQKVAVAGDVSSYGLSDDAFKQKYPILYGLQQDYMQGSANALTNANNTLPRQNTLTNLGIDKLYDRLTTGSASGQVSQDVIGAGRNLINNSGNETAITSQGKALFDDSGNENAITGAGTSLIARDANLDALTGAYGAAAGQALTRSQNPLGQNLKDLQTQAGQRLNAAPDAAYSAMKGLGAAQMNGPAYQRLQAAGMDEATGKDYQALHNRGMGFATGSTPIDPLVSQELARHSLMQGAASLGAQNLAKGSAGQAAVARNLGLGTLDYINNQTALGEGLLGAANAQQNQGLGVLGEARNQQNQGVSLVNQGQGGLDRQRAEALGEVNTSEGLNTQAQQLANSTLSNYGNLYNVGTNQQLARTSTGANLLNQAGQLSLSRKQTAANFLNQAEQLGLSRTQAAGALLGEGQQLGETYQQDTQNMLGGVTNMVNAQRAIATGDITNASQLFAPRTYGIGGQGAAQTYLNEIASKRNRDVAAYNAAVQAAQFATNQASQQAGLNASASNANIAGGATVAAAVALAAACGIARAVYGTEDTRWKVWRNWLMNHAPRWVRRFYLRAIPKVTPLVKRHEPLRFCLQKGMDWVVNAA
jgi:hypothetical protein